MNGLSKFSRACWLACLVAGPVALPAIAAPPKARLAPENKQLVAPAIVKGDPAVGKYKAESERCLECHGSAGPGQGYSNGTEGKFAKLAGQYPEYIVKQIRDFRSGARRYEFMAMMAKSINDTDLADIAAYFGAERAMQQQGRAANAIGKNLFVNGDAARNIVPCISCHGAAGQGGASFADGGNPVIGGQGLRYLEKQLFDWRSGERNNSAGGVMNAVTKALSDAEIQALAHYISDF